MHRVKTACIVWLKGPSNFRPDVAQKKKKKARKSDVFLLSPPSPSNALGFPSPLPSITISNPLFSSSHPFTTSSPQVNPRLTLMAFSDPSSSTSYTSTGLPSPIPRDARLIALILASTGVTDVEPAVLLQLLEFAHRYTYDVLSDALVYSDHANARQAGSNLTLDDVNLAIQTRVNYSFTKPPEKDVSDRPPHASVEQGKRY